MVNDQKIRLKIHSPAIMEEWNYILINPCTSRFISKIQSRIKEPFFPSDDNRIPLHCFLSSFLIISIHSTYILTSQMHQIKPPSFTYTLLHQNPERTTLTQAPPTFPIIQNNLRKNFTPLLPSTPRYQQFQIHTNKSHQINKKFSIFIIIINKIKQKRLQGFPGTQNRTETLDYLQNQRHWITGQERTSRGWRGAGPL